MTIAVGLASLSACADQTAPGSSPSSESTSASIPTAEDSRVPMDNGPSNLVASTATVDRLGRRDFADIYGGLVVDEARSGVNVYLTRRSATVEQALRDSAPELTVTFKTARQSLVAMDQLQQKIVNAIPKLARSGIQIASSMTSISDGLVIVNIVGLEASDAATIRSLVGSDLVEFRNVASLPEGT